MVKLGSFRLLVPTVRLPRRDEALDDGEDPGARQGAVVQGEMGTEYRFAGYAAMVTAGGSAGTGSPLYDRPASRLIRR